MTNGQLLSVAAVILFVAICVGWRLIDIKKIANSDADEEIERARVEQRNANMVNGALRKSKCRNNVHVVRARIKTTTGERAALTPKYLGRGIVSRHNIKCSKLNRARTGVLLLHRSSDVFYMTNLGADDIEVYRNDIDHNARIVERYDFIVLVDRSKYDHDPVEMLKTLRAYLETYEGLPVRPLTIMAFE